MFATKLIIIIAIVFRVLSVVISLFNEHKLKRVKAVEFGASNSRLLIIMHVLFYIACAIELYINETNLNSTASTYGFCIYLFSIFILYYVIYSLRSIWTFKLIIAPPDYHHLNKGFLFKYFRHPNYYLSVIPELIGIAIYCHSWHSLLFIFPIYLIPLIKRIRLEESIMKDHFPEY